MGALQPGDALLIHALHYRYDGRSARTETGLKVQRLLSGPYGGDAQIGALVAERRVRCVIFFWDPLTTQPPPTLRVLKKAITSYSHL
jgi:methylglyoxal synthase